MKQRTSFQRLAGAIGVAAVLTVGLLAGPAVTPARASGSDGAGSAETGDAAAYNTGKGVFHSKLACSGCPMAGKSLDATTARELLSNKRGVSLSAEESAALDVYLKRRFKL
jgi:hypothetical protein